MRFSRTWTPNPIAIAFATLLAVSTPRSDLAVVRVAATPAAPAAVGLSRRRCRRMSRLWRWCWKGQRCINLSRRRCRWMSRPWRWGCRRQRCINRVSALGHFTPNPAAVACAPLLAASTPTFFLAVFRFAVAPAALATRLERDAICQERFLSMVEVVYPVAEVTLQQNVILSRRVILSEVELELPFAMVTLQQNVSVFWVARISRSAQTGICRGQKTHNEGNPGCLASPRHWLDI